MSALAQCLPQCPQRERILEPAEEGGRHEQAGNLLSPSSRAHEVLRQVVSVFFCQAAIGIAKPRVRTEGSHIVCSTAHIQALKCMRISAWDDIIDALESLPV